MLPADIQDSLFQQLGITVEAASSLTGGCIHQAARIQTDQGVFFIKWNGLYQAHNLQVEAKGLSLLSSTHTFEIPGVLLQKETEFHTYLLLSFVEATPGSGSYWENFGRNLAMLHQHTQEEFGLSYDNYIGALPQANTLCGNWVTFFRDVRLKPMLSMARKKGLLPSSTDKQFDRLLQKLPELIPEGKPSCIHGDLWGGNILTGKEGLPALIDPAVYYANHEIELAFMTLFDSQPPSFYESYAEIFPLVPAWESRLALYNLYPLLVHLNLFGSGYLNSIQNTLKHYV